MKQLMILVLQMEEIKIIIQYRKNQSVIKWGLT